MPRRRATLIITLASLLLGCSSVASPGDAATDALADTTSSETGPDADYGMCGPQAVTCLCGCGSDVRCQNNCYSASLACLRCVNDGVASCCASESPAYNNCVAAAQMPGDAGPACAATDSACINMRCQREAAALQTCLATQACHDNMRACTGVFPGRCP